MMPIVLKVEVKKCKVVSAQRESIGSPDVRPTCMLDNGWIPCSKINSPHEDGVYVKVTGEDGRATIHHVNKSGALYNAQSRIAGCLGHDLSERSFDLTLSY